MKILYAIQGTGNGHLSRAREIIPHLLHHGELDILVSGTQAKVSLTQLIKYKKHGLSFTFGTHGNVDLINSIKEFKPLRLLKDILQFPVENYDLIINDFEPISAWACKIKKKPCIALSHQASFLSAKCPRPKHKNWFGEAVLKHYAPVKQAIGFHFERFDDFIYTPVIRSEIRNREIGNKEHITVYLTGHSDAAILKHLTPIKDIQWEVFSKEAKVAKRHEHVHIFPIQNEAFTQSLASGNGLLTAGGFEGPAEAIFLNKKVFAIPLYNQYEQLCNAAAMKKIGVTVADKLNADTIPMLQNWVLNGKAIEANYPDQTAAIIEKIVSNFKDKVFR
jgi:uncharacterized protein (TIGR00661 family)